jgi:hypothetical protein
MSVAPVRPPQSWLVPSELPCVTERGELTVMRRSGRLHPLVMLGAVAWFAGCGARTVDLGGEPLQDAASSDPNPNSSPDALAHDTSIVIENEDSALVLAQDRR